MLSWPCLMLEGFFPKWQSFSPWSCSFRNHFLSSYCRPENSPAREDQWCGPYILGRWKKVNQGKRRGLCPHSLPRLSPSPAQSQQVYVLGEFIQVMGGCGADWQALGPRLLLCPTAAILSLPRGQQNLPPREGGWKGPPSPSDSPAAKSGHGIQCQPWREGNLGNSF